MDDVVLHTCSWSEHLDLLQELFAHLRKASLTINLSKCEFGKARVTYLGKVVGGGHVRPVNAKVEAVCAFPVPTTRRELPHFLGLAGYYRAFCQNFATVVMALTDLLSPKNTFSVDSGLSACL